MKNYNEMANDVLRRIGEHETEQQKRRKTISRIVTPLCCCCLVALLGFGMWQGGMFNATPPTISGEQSLSGDNNHTNPNDSTGQNNDKQNQGGQTSTPNNNSQTGTLENNDPIRIAWVINKVEGQIGAAKLNFSPDKYYSEKKTLADIAAYLGKDLSTLEGVMPQGFVFFGRYETDFFYKLDGELAYDSCVFGYKRDDQQITVKVSKIGVPYDCMYMLNNPTVSSINGVDVTIGGIYKIDNSDELELVFADFSHGGLKYRLTIENVSSDDYKCLNSIITELTK